MLEKIREGSSGITAKVILGLVIATFIFAGVGSYTSSVDTSAASVNGEKISQQEFEQAYQNQRARMEQQYGEMFEQIANNDSYIQNMRTNTLEQLINEELLLQNAAKLNIRVSDEQIKAEIMGMSEFQVDGVFDNNRYLMLINQSGFGQTSAFRDYLRTDMTRRQLISSLLASEISLPYQQELDAKLANQTRSIRYANVDSAQFRDGIEVTEEEINAFYQENKARFATQEQVKVEYVLLDLDNISKDEGVSQDVVEQYYNNNLSSYTANERRRASHILFEIADDEAAAQAKAEEVLAKINAGEDFAALASEFSADTFSGENGGDLDWFERGAMDQSFEDATFALTLDDNISAVIKSDFGFHIIKLTALEESKVKAFADVEAEITAQLNRDTALETFYEIQGKLAEVAFESPDSLDEAAGVVDGEIMQSVWLNRNGNAAPFDQANVADVAFSELVLVDGLNSDVIEVQTDKLAMVVRLLEHKPAATMPLEDVSAPIKQQLISQKATEKGKALADSILAKLIAGEDITADLSANGSAFVEANIVTRQGAEVARNISQKAFLLAKPVDGQVSAATTVPFNGNFAIVELLSVTEGQVGELDANAEQRSLMTISQASIEAYVENLKKDAEITRNLPVNSTPQF